MCSSDEKPTNDETPASNQTPASDGQRPPLPEAARDDPRWDRRRRKEALLSQISELALEGHSCREIGARLRVSKTNVHRWLQSRQQERRSNLADAAGTIADAVACYRSIYREAMEAWRKSKADKEVRLVEHLENECGSRCGHKKSIRSESRVGDVIFLAQARGAVDAICKLVSRDAQRRTKVEAPDDAPIPPDAPRKDDLHNMDDAGHRAVETRSTAEMRMSNGPLPNGHGAKKS